MSRRRVLAVATAAGLLFFAPAAPVAADGLSRFEEALRAQPGGLLSYESGKSLGDNGFVLERVTFKPPSEATDGVKTEPIHIDRITVENFDFASHKKTGTPNFATLRAEGISIDPKSFDIFDLRELTGRDAVKADFQLDYRFDPQLKTMTLNRLALDLRELARIELSLTLEGIDPEDRSGADTASLRAASLVFEDRTLLGTAVPAVARARGIDPETIAKLAEEILDSLRPGQGAATIAVLDAIAGYVDDYRRPKGPLRITLNPPGNIPLSAISELADPEEALRRLGLTVSYTGARQPNGANRQNPAR
jgi:hypothetical protein